MKTNNLIGICVATPTEEYFKRALSIAEENGWNTSNLRFNVHGYETCIRFSNEGGNLYYADLEHYLKLGMHIHSIEDLIAINKDIALFKSLTKVSLDALGEPPSKSSKIKSTGGSSAYYQLTIKNNQGESISCETGNVIQALVGDNFALGNVVKALRRIYMDSIGQGKEGIDMQYDVNKCNYFLNDYLARYSPIEVTEEEERIQSDLQIN